MALDADVRPEELELTALYVDARYTPKDFEVALPISALEGEGRIGGAALPPLRWAD